MKYRLLTGLFIPNIGEENSHYLPSVAGDNPTDFTFRSMEEVFRLATAYSAESSYPAYNPEDYHEWRLKQLPGTRESLRRIRRLAARKRQAYASMAVELLVKLYPEIENKRIHAGRLAQLGLPAKPPKAGWADRHADEKLSTSDTQNGKSFEDDIPLDLLDGYKEREERIESGRRQTAIEKAVIVERAISAGIGTAETVPGIIYEMDVLEFLKLTEGFPGLSRVDFKPHQDDDFPF